VNGLEQRMRVLAGLESVDWLVAFPEDTPESLLELVQPDVLVKGGDYAPEDVVGAEQVRAGGGEVRVLSLVEDCSTSAIIDRLQDS
jgi:D-beta-D-heptose 7-phosphate kinase/D-beta-D-heptose 1-phosphate adenosyltransferase